LRAVANSSVAISSSSCSLAALVSTFASWRRSGPSQCSSAPDRLSGLRDRALLLLGFAGAFRRSELVALDVADIEETETGLLVTIRSSKTDQEGQGVISPLRAVILLAL
jgi:integrase